MKEIETPRLILRAPRESDANDLFSYAQSPTVGPSAGWLPHSSVEESLNVIRDYIRKGNVYFLEHKITHQMIGSVSLHSPSHRCLPDGLAVQLGYALSEDYHGQGLMPEALSFLIDYIFSSTRVEIIEVTHLEHNYKSKRVIEKLGFTYEGTIRHSHIRLDTPEYANALVYSMTKEEYLSIKEVRKEKENI